MKRLLVVADHAFIVEAIRLALRQTAGFELVGFFDGRQPLRSEFSELGPDVVLVDDMEHHHGEALERLREAAEDAPGAKRLLLATCVDDTTLDAAFEAGADAVLSKTLHPIALGTLLRETARGNIVHRHRRSTVAGACPLTSRESQILGLAAQGYTNSRIARQLWVTEQTVKFHLSNCYRKLGVANRTEASRYAYQQDLVGTPDAVASYGP
jgi:DNA-binding NarL/FixJ family response regulator